MEHNDPRNRDRENQRKPMRNHLKKNHHLNSLSGNLVFYEKQWHCLTHICRQLYE